MHLHASIFHFHCFSISSLSLRDSSLGPSRSSCVTFWLSVPPVWGFSMSMSPSTPLRFAGNRLLHPCALSPVRITKDFFSFFRSPAFISTFFSCSSSSWPSAFQPGAAHQSPRGCCVYCGPSLCGLRTTLL